MNKRKEDWSLLTRRQKLGYWLIRLLGKLQQWLYHRVIGTLVWRSRDGTCTPIKKMENSHLYNCIRKIRRDGEQQEMLEVLLSEWRRRGFQEVLGRIWPPTKTTKWQPGEHQ